MTTRPSYHVGYVYDCICTIMYTYPSIPCITMFPLHPNSMPVVVHPMPARTRVAEMLIKGLVFSAAWKRESATLQRPRKIMTNKDVNHGKKKPMVF